MAEIAVERKKGFPFWVWLLLALAILLLLWAVLGRDRGEAARQQDDPIRDLSAFYSAENPDTLIGREVHIENARVLRVSGDRDFWVGDSEGRQVLVILNQVQTPQQPRIEGRYDVNPGQNIAIVEGEVKRLPAWEEAQSRWKLDPGLRANFENQHVYIEAEKLEIKDWRESSEPVQTEPR